MEGLNNGDTAWMAMSCALVLFMTPGLAFFYGGLVRDSNIVNTMMMSIISMGLTTITWLVFGFTVRDSNIVNTMMMSIISMGLTTITWLVFGFTWSFDEWGAGKGFTYVGFRNLDAVWTFAIIAAAIISGAVVERIRFSAYAIFIVAWVLAVYVPLCHWIWGGGWIAEMGAKDCESAESAIFIVAWVLAVYDFAGGTVVHISSGTSAFALASLLGERKHRSESFPSNLPFVILGGGILWLGWTGFNGGSAFAANGDCALAIATTYVAAAAAMITWVNITPCAGFVEPLGALGVAYGKNENSGKPNAFGEHSQRFKPEEAPTLLTGSGLAGSAAEKPTEV
eukprot:s2698_g11.t1